MLLHQQFLPLYFSTFLPLRIATFLWSPICAQKSIDGFVEYVASFNPLNGVWPFRADQEKETLDSFVKVNLLCGEKRVKKKTAVKKATTSPVWNEAMSFDVPASSLASSAIEVNALPSLTFNFLFGFTVPITDRGTHVD